MHRKTDNCNNNFVTNVLHFHASYTIYTLKIKFKHKQNPKNVANFYSFFNKIIISNNNLHIHTTKHH